MEATVTRHAGVGRLPIHKVSVTRHPGPVAYWYDQKISMLHILTEFLLPNLSAVVGGVAPVVKVAYICGVTHNLTRVAEFPGVTLWGRLPPYMLVQYPLDRGCIRDVRAFGRL